MYVTVNFSFYDNTKNNPLHFSCSSINNQQTYSYTHFYIMIIIITEHVYNATVRKYIIMKILSPTKERASTEKNVAIRDAVP